VFLITALVAELLNIKRHGV